MKNEKMFEVALRSKFRYPFRGLICTEDLYDLSTESLDKIFKELNSQMKQTKEESLLGLKTKEDKELEMKIEIVKYIVATKLEEADNKMRDKYKKEERQKILEIIANKKDASLENKSVEELEAMLNEL